MSSKNRIRVTSTAIRDRAHADEILGEVRDCQIRLNQLDVIREDAIKLIDDEQKPERDELNSQIKAHGELLRSWSERNPDEFGTQKSLKLTHGVFGFRTGQNSLVTLGKTAWDKAVEKVRSVLGADFIRNKPEVNKEAILSAFSEGKLEPEKLREAGLRVKKDEVFFIEPKIETTDKRTTVPA